LFSLDEILPSSCLGCTTLPAAGLLKEIFVRISSHSDALWSRSKQREKEKKFVPEEEEKL
jgi:hypothetical protein